MNDWRKAHNKRVRERNTQIESVRKRLKQESVKSIDDCVDSCRELHESLIECVAGGHLLINLEEISRFVSSYQKLRQELCLQQEVES